MGTLAVRPESVTFHNLGDEISGTILPSDEGKAYVDMVQTIIGTDQPKLDKNGRQMMMPVIRLQTTQRIDASDDGQRTLYAASVNMQIGLRNAIQSTGAGDLEVGGWVRVRYSADEPSTKAGFTPSKQYEVEYRRPAGSLGGARPSNGAAPAQDAVGAARAVQQAVSAAKAAPAAPGPAQPALPYPQDTRSPVTGQGGLGSGKSPADMVKIRELAGYGLDTATIVAAMHNQYTMEAIEAVLAIPTQ